MASARSNETRASLPWDARTGPAARIPHLTVAPLAFPSVAYYIGTWVRRRTRFGGCRQPLASSRQLVTRYWPVVSDVLSDWS